jgi:sulfite reductase (ferredoxin)
MAMSQSLANSVSSSSAKPQVPAKRSGVETIKETSHQLRGTIALELVSDADHFNDQNKQLLKFHGTYQQDDRDARKNRHKDKLPPGAGAARLAGAEVTRHTSSGKEYIFMVRCKIPGGRLTAKQYLAVDDLAGAYGNGTLRFTTRQGIQLHGVLKEHLKETIAGINQCLLTTLGACGDVERNVMCCPAPHFQDGVHAQLQETAANIAAQLAPRTRAYHEIWLNGEPVRFDAATAPAANAPDSDLQAGNPGADTEPLYGKVYLPRKFKTGLALPEDNCIDVYGQDLGFLAIVQNGSIVGYNVLVGGGMGMTHGNENTFPMLARPICYVPVHAVMGMAEAVLKLFRDHGNRADRKRARIKYVVHDWGVEKFRRVLSEYVGGELQPPRPVEVSGYDPHHGWHPQGNGKWYYGLSIENGRVKDKGEHRLRSGLRTIIERFQPGLRITPLQDLLICDLDASDRDVIERILAEYGIRRPDELSTLRRHSLACPAVPTCGLALSEAERVLPGIIDQLEVELKRLGLQEEKLSVRMTGCPNGCTRPYQSDIGLVGRSGDKYTIFVGGQVLGNRLNFQLKDLMPLSEIVPTLKPLLEHFKGNRQLGESFGDFCHRLGVARLQALLPSEVSNGKDLKHLLSHQVKSETNGLAKSTPAAEVTHHPDGPHSSESPASIEPPVETRSEAVSSETALAGAAGEERPDYTLRLNTDGSVRETIIYFYGNDHRAAGAQPGDPLRREAVYLSRVDPYRLHSARKVSDTHFVGPAGQERRDYRFDYYPDGRISRTILFYYDENLRATDASPGSAIRRQVEHEGASQLISRSGP